MSERGLHPRGVTGNRSSGPKDEPVAISQAIGIIVNGIVVYFGYGEIDPLLLVGIVTVIQAVAAAVARALVVPLSKLLPR